MKKCGDGCYAICDFCIHLERKDETWGLCRVGLVTVGVLETCKKFVCFTLGESQTLKKGADRQEVTHESEAQGVKPKYKFPTYQTVCVDDCICPDCGFRFDGQKACNYSMQTIIIDCPKCGQEMKVDMSTEFMCTAMEDD